MMITNFLKRITQRFIGNKYFTIPLAEAKAYIEHLPQAEDDFSRSYYQYKCQMKSSGRLYWFFANLAAIFLLLPYYWLPAKRIDNNAEKCDAVHILNKNLGARVIPPTLYSEFGEIKECNDGYMVLLKEDRMFIKRLRKIYPLSFFFRLKCIMRIAAYRYAIQQYTPKAIIASCEYSFTSSVLTAFCEQNSIEHINVSHGLTIYAITSSYFRFHRFYIYDAYFISIYIRLRADSTQFKLISPEIYIIPNDRPVAASYDFKYYMGPYSKKQMIVVAEALSVLQKKGYQIAVRPHPLHYSSKTKPVVKDVFKNIFVESPDIPILDSIAGTKNVIASMSHTFYIAYINHKAIIIDDMMNPIMIEYMRDADAIFFQKDHRMLSELIKE